MGQQTVASNHNPRSAAVMSNEWITVQQRKLDEKITAEYRAVTSPQPPDDEWIYELDNDAWGAWSRGSGVSRDAG